MKDVAINDVSMKNVQKTQSNETNTGDVNVLQQASRKGGRRYSG